MIWEEMTSEGGKYYYNEVRANYQRAPRSIWFQEPGSSGLVSH